MTTFLTIVHVILCLFLIGVVLLQSGRSGGMGVLSGAASQQVFGGRGAGNFLQRVTSVVAFMFLITCFTLGFLASSTRDRGLATPEQTSTTVTVGQARSDAGSEAGAASDSGSASAPSTTSAPASSSAESSDGSAPAADSAAVPAAESDAGAGEQ